MEIIFPIDLKWSLAWPKVDKDTIKSEVSRFVASPQYIFGFTTSTTMPPSRPSHPKSHCLHPQVLFLL